MKKSLSFHPFLLAIFPILALYAQNMSELSFSVTLMPLAVALSSTLVLLLILWLITRNITKSALILSLFLVLFFSYGHVLTLVIELGIGKIYIGGVLVGTPARYILSIWVTVFVCCAYFIMKTHRDLRKLSNFINIAVVCMVVISLINIGAYELKRPNLAMEPYIPPENYSTVKHTDSESNDSRPDIYYIILDAYGRADILEEFHDFNNYEFIDYLTSQGFYVASKSRSNYIPTGNSLASSLNMDFLDQLCDEVGGNTTDKGPLYAMLQNHNVWQFLKSQGYKYIHVGSHWEATQTNKYADINYAPSRISEFALLLYRTTLLCAIPYDLTGTPSNQRLEHWEHALYQFDRLLEVPDLKEDIEEPIFVFAHIVIPHIPHVFDENGNFLEFKETDNERTERYLGQLIFCNNQLRQLVDKILLKAETPPVIILQGDHGPASLALSNYDELCKEDQLRITMSPLNAYFLPGDGSDLLYESITPVNSFRVVFNSYFGTKYKLLDDRSYNAATHGIYNPIDVTEILKE